MSCLLVKGFNSTDSKSHVRYLQYSRPFKRLHKKRQDGKEENDLYK